MTASSRGSSADHLRDWAPDPVHLARRVDPWPAAAFADLLDTSAPPLGPGDPLPALWHWFTLLDHPPQAALGADGHPSSGSFLPPIPHRRRMFAGGRYRQERPVPVGAELTARSSVADVSVKTGRSGEMVFVTVRHELSVAGTAIGVEEQDIVYRSDPGVPARPTRPVPGAADLAPGWRLTLDADPVLLFRFSALTYNAHRIHYDHPYATGVEGHPGLVVHGPLLALLALELPRRHAPDEPVSDVAYRLVRPVFGPADVVATGHRTGPAVDLHVAASGAAPSLVATATLGARTAVAPAPAADEPGTP